MKTAYIIGGLLVVGGGVGVWLYRRGRLQHAVLAQEGGILPTLRAGVRGLAADLKHVGPSSSTAKPAKVDPRFVGKDPRQPQRYPTHSRRAPVQFVAPRVRQSKADLIRQGIAT